MSGLYTLNKFRKEGVRLLMEQVKECKDCYWKFHRQYECAYKQVLFDGVVCDKFKLACCKCSTRESIVEYEGKRYCKECLFKEVGIECREVTTYYTSGGEYLGNEYSDMGEVINDILEGCYD